MPDPGSRSLLEFVPAPVLVGDPDGRVVYVNPAFEADFGLSFDEAAGQPVANLFAGGGREAVLRAVARVCDPQSQAGSARFGLLVDDRGYKALASAVEAEGGRVGVILLLVRESAAESRLQSFRREVQSPLEDLYECLARVVERASGPEAAAQRLAIADGVRALDRIHKWSDGLAASLQLED